MAQSINEVGLAVYERLCEINRGFEQVRRALIELGRSRLFDTSELQRCRELATESKAVINSYLTNTLETAETDHAGRLFRRRIARERKDDAGAR